MVLTDSPGPAPSDASRWLEAQFPDSVVIWFKVRGSGGPVGIVIGEGHSPRYVFEDFRTEPVSPL